MRQTFKDLIITAKEFSYDNKYPRAIKCTYTCNLSPIPKTLYISPNKYQGLWDKEKQEMVIRDDLDIAYLLKKQLKNHYGKTKKETY